MNVLFLIHDISHGAGTERVLTQIANSLVEDSFDITIASCKNGDSSHFPLDKRVKLISLYGEKAANGFFRKINNIIALRKICSKNHYDVIIFVDTSLILYVPFLKKNREKVIAWEHFNYFTAKTFFQRAAQKYAVRFASAIVVLTDKDRENYNNNEHVKGKLVRIYNPVELCTNTSQIPMRDNTVIAVGRLEKQKGFDLLLEAWGYIERENANWRLKIVGKGSNETLLKNIVKSKSLHNVDFYGYSKNIEDIYKTSSILVCSSRYEGFGMTLIEAQSHSLPVVSFDCPVGPSEIIENETTGLLVENGNTYALAQAILRLINDQELRKELVINARESVKRFEKQRIALQWREFLFSIIDQDGLV